LKAAHKDYNLSALFPSSYFAQPFLRFALMKRPIFLSLSRIQSSNAFGPWSALVHTLYRPLFHSLSVPIYPSPSSLVQLQLSSCRIAVLPGFKSFVCVKTLFIVVNFRVQGLFGPLLFGSLTWLNRIENLQKRGKL